MRVAPIDGWTILRNGKMWTNMTGAGGMCAECRFDVDELQGADGKVVLAPCSALMISVAFIKK